MWNLRFWRSALGNQKLTLTFICTFDLRWLTIADKISEPLAYDTIFSYFDAALMCPAIRAHIVGRSPQFALHGII